jgi:hypothetical protein
VFSWDRFLETVGVLAPRCAAPTGDGKFHFVAGQDDVYIHDGTTITSLLNGRMKRTLFNAIDALNYGNSFVFAKPDTDEMWFCYPESGNTHPTRALIWNYGVKSQFGALSEAAVDFRASASADVVADAEEVWDGDAGVWDSDGSVWDSVSKRKTLVLRPEINRFMMLDAGVDNNGTPVAATIQRTGLAIAGQRRGGEWVNDFSLVKFVKRVWMRASGAPFQVRPGTQETVDGVLSWSFPMTFDPSTMLYVDFLKTGVVLAIEFSGTQPFAVQGYKLEVSPAGRLMPIESGVSAMVTEV